MHILVLGGSGFIGRHTVMKLLQNKFNVTLVNRGISKMDFPGEVNRLFVDRNNSKELRDILKQIKPDAIIDFSCYEPKHLKPCLEIFKDYKIPYIFCSSVYVYQHYSTLLENENELLKFKVPIDVNAERRARKFYGYNKIKCEDLLLKEENLKVKILRMPPIIGRYNNNFERELVYLRRMKNKGVCILPERRGEVFHFLNSENVSDICVALCTKQTNNSIYNLANRNITSLDRYLNIMADSLNIPFRIFNIPQSEMINFNYSTDFPFCYPFDIAYSSEDIYNDLGINEEILNSTLISDIQFDIKNVPKDSLNLTERDKYIYEYFNL